ncbi:MAG: hypothetical protein ACLQU3_28070 [Limisphaerales bacterium]
MPDVVCSGTKPKARRWTKSPDAPASHRAGLSIQSDDGTIIENRYQLKVMPTGATRLILLLAADGWNPTPAASAVS